MTSLSIPKEYVVSVATNNIREAIGQTANALYDLLDQALMTADDEDESDFDQFARETLQVLGRFPDQLSADAESHEYEADADDNSAEFAD